MFFKLNGGLGLCKNSQMREGITNEYETWSCRLGGGLGGFAHIRSRSKSQVMQMNHNLKEINEDMDNGFVNYSHYKEF